MYCCNCGTINNEPTEICLKCGHDLSEPKAKIESDIDIALAARPKRSSSTVSNKSVTRFLVLAIILTSISALPIVFMTLQIKKDHPILTRQAGPASGDNEAGLGLDPRQRSEVIARDSAKKANTRKAQTTLEQYFAGNGHYPNSLDELDPKMLGFVVDPQAYLYEPMAGGSDYRLTVSLESDIASGPNVVREGEVTKLVITGSGY
jgi:hypothetical protein